MMRISLLAVLCAVLAGLSSARAQLKWEALQKTVEVGPGAINATAEFSFKNTGKYPVKIAALKTCCGCFKAESDKRIYRPGESGTIIASFELAGRYGRQVKPLEVQTDDVKNPATSLSIVLELPRKYQVKPEQAGWEVGDPARGKTIQLLVRNLGGATVQEAKCDNPIFATVLKEAESPGTWLLEIKPETTGRPAKGMVTVSFSDPALEPIFIPVGIEKKP